ncbi:MAG: multicopper oxidase domain-containing protein [Nitrospirae bacterium]|nr:multicopper oxidase domain-containing protein [Nitrospirota bacterium]
MEMRQKGFKGVAVRLILLLTGSILILSGGPAGAVDPTYVGTGMQCPNDIDNLSVLDKASGISWSTGGLKGDEDFDRDGDGVFDFDPNVVCRRVGVTDGYVKMPDGSSQYIFGFVDLTGVPENEIVDYKNQAHLPGPVIEVGEGQSLYMTETNLSLYIRPDLFDPHTIHFHGFPHAMGIFDGVPENSIAIPGGSSFTYYYQTNDPGTYPYHCHVEPVEHIQMGMVATIVVHPRQDTATEKYAYNDGGTGGPDTRYDSAYNLLITEFDSDKHWNLENIQEGTNLWSDYKPNFFTINGRSYPDTVLSDNDAAMTNAAPLTPYIAQTSSLITAQAGKKILIRVNNMGFKTHTLTIPGIPMHIVGEDARLLKGPARSDGTRQDLSLIKTTYSMAGGKTVDIILDTTGLTPGTYFLYGRELNSQSNLSREDRLAGMGSENRGGMMTEIHIQ